MKRYAIIENGKVISILVYQDTAKLRDGSPDPNWEPEFASPLVSIQVTIDSPVEAGWFYLNGQFVSPDSDESLTIRMIPFRAERDQIFESLNWVRERHLDRVDMGIDDESNWSQWLVYFQALRDMPDQLGFNPDIPQWPVQPE